MFPLCKGFDDACLHILGCGKNRGHDVPVDWAYFLLHRCFRIVGQKSNFAMRTYSDDRLLVILTVPEKLQRRQFITNGSKQ